MSAAAASSRGGGRLTRRSIVEAAMDILSVDGLEGLTMRRLGRHLGVDGAAFYRHFADKAELLRAVGRAALAEIDAPLSAEGLTWPEWVLRTRTTYRALLIQRPYMAPLILDGHVPWSTLPAYRVERDLMLAEGIGEDRVQSAFDAIDAYVVGSAMITGAVRRSEQAAAARTQAEGAGDDQHAEQDFRWGLEALLSGILLVHGARPAEAAASDGVAG